MGQKKWWGERLDQALVRRGLVDSRAKAKALILAGRVRLANGNLADPDQPVALNEPLSIERGPELRYASRGGLKLEGALEHFGIQLDSKIALDIGSSTGGFTDCLLQHGAQFVYAVDVGRGLLDAKLRSDPRVKSLEKINARYLRGDLFDPKPTFATVDVAFISLKKILPALLPCLALPYQILALVKPQFECRRSETVKGIVKEERVRERVVEEIRLFCEEQLHLKTRGVFESRYHGAKGNIEYFLYL